MSAPQRAAAPARSGAACRTCFVIRFFLISAFALIALMGLAAEHFAVLSHKLPSVGAIALLFPLIGGAAFVIRLVRWHRAGRPMR